MYVCHHQKLFSQQPCGSTRCALLESNNALCHIRQPHCSTHVGFSCSNQDKYGTLQGVHVLKVQSSHGVTRTWSRKLPRPSGKKKKKNKWCKLLLLRSFKTHLAYPAQEQHHLVFLNWNFSFATSYNIFDSIFFFQRYTTTVIMNTETFFIALKTQCQSITRATWRDNCNQTHRYVSDTQLYWVAIIV